MSENQFPNQKASSVSVQDKGNGYTTYRVGFPMEQAAALLEQLQEALKHPETTGAMFTFSYGMTGNQKYPNGDGFFRPKFSQRQNTAPKNFAPRRYGQGK